MHSRVWIERLAIVASAITVGWSVLVACSGVVSEPGGGCFIGASPLTCNTIQVTIAADGPYTITIQNQTVAGASGQVVNFLDLPAGTNVVSGTTSAASLNLDFRTIPSVAGVAVQRGSMATTAGPSGEVGPCQLAYRIPAGGTRPQNFRGSFTLATGGTAC